MSNQLELDPSWPGLDAPAGQVEVDVEALYALADKLESEADQLSGDGAGTPARLEADTSLPCPAFGSWQTAIEMEQGHSEARRVIVHYFRETVELMREAARLARQTAESHERNDQALQESLQQTQTSG